MIRDEMQEKILKAALACIEEEGFQNVTVRKIAQRAGVNVAAINYYFSSKKQLMEELFEETMNESFFDKIHNYSTLWEQDPIQAINRFLNDLFEELLNNQAIAKAHFYECFVNDNYDTHMVEKFNSFLKPLYTLIESELPHDDPKDKKMILIQVFSTILMPSLLPKLIRDDFLEMELHEPEFRNKYIQLVIETFMTMKIKRIDSYNNKEKI